MKLSNVRSARGLVPLFALLALGAGMAGCSGDDGKDGAPGAAGPAGPAGPTGPAGATGATGATGAGAPVAAAKPLESCGVCHDKGSAYDAGTVHATKGNATVTAQTFKAVDPNLELSFNLKIDGVAANDYTILSAYSFNVATGTRTSLTAATLPIMSAGVNGTYTVTIPNGAAAGDLRYLLIVQNAAKTNSAAVVADYDSPLVTTTPKAELVSHTACANCHSEKFISHEHHSGPNYGYGNPVDLKACAVCHDRSTTTLPHSIEIGHSIHNSHNMPSGEWREFGVTYPTYMTNCSVCHDTDASLAAANAMPISGQGCLSCHGTMEGFGFAANDFHLGFTKDTACSTCHNDTATGIDNRNVVTEFHNGLATERSGIIWNGVDTSVVEGNKIAMGITGIVYEGTNMKISWTAKYGATDVNPCNATVGAGAPVFHAGTSAAGTASNMSFIRSYAQGDDFIMGLGTSPGAPSSVNLSTTNTTCVGNVATTTIAVETAPAGATRGMVALQGKPWVPHAKGTGAMQVRAFTPTREFVVGTGAPVTTQRRAVADSAQCVKCHVGSLYQHGGNRVDNVKMCVMCHNAASNEQNVRAGMGVDKTDSYDGLNGHTYEFKSMLHGIHSSGEAGSKPVVIYRSNGIYAWAPSTDLLRNWPSGALTCKTSATATENNGYIVAGSSPETCRTHNFHTPTYPRALSECIACHVSDFPVVPDQAKNMATTVDTGASFTGQTDDVLMGAGQAACTTCHQDAATKSHALQNGWEPAALENGRQTIIDLAK